MRISYCSWGAASLPIEEVIPAVAGIGYTGLELAVTRHFKTELSTLDASRRTQIKGMLKDYELVLSGVAGHTSLSETDADKNAANMQRLKDTIDLASEVRTDGEPAVVASLLGGSEDDWGTLKNVLVERVGQLGDYAASRDALFAIEPHCGTVMDLPRKVVWLMEQVDHPAVSVNYDMSHFVIRGMPLEDHVPQLAPLSVHTHVKDQRGIYPRHEFMTPGSGPFDYIPYLQAMHEAGYDGWIGMEVSMMVQRLPGYNAITDAALGYWALKHAFELSGVPLEE